MPDLSYQNVNWALTGVAGALTVGRYVIRALVSGRFHSDDAAHLLAFLLLVIHGATNQVTADAKAQLATDVANKKLSSDVLLAQYHYVYQLNTANNTFLYLIFWVVKVAFLLFYRLLFGSSPRFMKAWWAALVFTVVTYIVPFAGVLATCAGVDTVAGYAQCDSATQYRAAKLEYSCVFNVVTDAIIMALPLWMLRGLQMNGRQKIGLGVIFSLGLFCIALDILRVVEALASNQALYTVLELNVAVIVSCLPTYRSLLSLRQRLLSRKASYSYGSRKASQSQRRASHGLEGSNAARSDTYSGTGNDEDDRRPLRDGNQNVRLQTLHAAPVGAADAATMPTAVHTASSDTSHDAAAVQANEPDSLQVHELSAEEAAHMRASTDA